MRFVLLFFAFSTLVGCSSKESELDSGAKTFSVVCKGTTTNYSVVNGKDVLIATKKTEENFINFKEGRVLDDDFECETWDEEKIICEKLIDTEDVIYQSRFSINRKTGSINWITEDKDDNLKYHTKDVFEGVCK